MKAFDEEEHRFYTGYSNREVLKAIEVISKLEDIRFRLEVETILLPEINEPQDIELLAMYISEINPFIQLFIEPYIASPSFKDSLWKEPSKEMLIEAVTRAMRHLSIVSYHPLYSEILEMRKTPRRVKFINFFPVEQS